MSTPSTGIKTGYDRWSNIYDHDANPLPPLEEPLIQQSLGEVRGWRVLDVGCGTGRHSLWLAAAGAKVTAIDFSEGMLAQARQKPGAETIDFIVHDLHQPLPFGDAAFDLVISGLVLEHITKLEPFYAELHRVLKPSGRAVMSTLHPSMFLRGSQARFTDPVTGEVVQPGSIPHSISELLLAALRVGFSLHDLYEVSPDAAFAERYPRAEKYLGWPMLLVMVFNGSHHDLA